MLNKSRGPGQCKALHMVKLLAQLSRPAFLHFLSDIGCCFKQLLILGLLIMDYR